MEVEMLLVAQLSDPHVTCREEEEAARALRRAVRHLLALPARPDVVLVTGDCTEHGDAAEYAVFQEALRPLPMPVYCVPGNHDRRPEMTAALGAPGTRTLDGFLQGVVDAGAWRLIGLDTHVPGEASGELCAARLAWLETQLQDAPQKPTLIFMHHPPARSGLDVMDRIGLRNAEAFTALVARSPQVKRVVAGHLHMALTRTLAGTLLMTAPGTCSTWLPDLAHPQRLSVQVQPPACLLHHCTAQGEVLSLTSVIGTEREGELDTLALHDGVQWRS